MTSTTCVNGHPRTQANALTWHWPDGRVKWRCRVCQDVRRVALLARRRAHRAANPLPPRKTWRGTYRDPETWFWSRVQKTETCWNWTGWTDAAGYGRAQIVRDGRKYKSAHRVAAYLAQGHIPVGLCALHECDNRRCVRFDPRHVYIGTHKRNAIDMIEHGRHKPMRGNANGNAVLSDDQAFAIYQRAAAGERHDWLGREYGISRPTMSRIIRGERFIHGRRLPSLPLRGVPGLKGEAHPRSRLTADDVREIRRMHAMGASTREIGARFDYSCGSVSHIINGKIWKDVV